MRITDTQRTVLAIVRNARAEGRSAGFTYAPEKRACRQLIERGILVKTGEGRFAGFVEWFVTFKGEK